MVKLPIDERFLEWKKFKKMKLEIALDHIKKFWINDKIFPFGQSNNSNHIERLQTELGILIPDIVQDYIQNYAPSQDFWFDTFGNPMRVYGIDNLKYKQLGYNYNPVKNEIIEGWKNSFFIFADEGADPFIIDFNEIGDGIKRLISGVGSWDNGEVIADTFGQFLLCSAAQHHAFNSFEDDPVIDNDKGFNLADNAAKWYFKNMKNWAGDYYKEWCSVFDNC